MTRTAMATLFRLVPLGALGALGVLAGCGGSGGSEAPGSTNPAPTGLAVLSSTPVDGALDVPASTPISVRFNMPIDSSTAGAAAFAVWSSAALPGTTLVSGDTVTFTPSAALEPFAPHSIRISQGLRSTGGEQLPGPVRLDFVTRDGTWTSAMTLPTDATLTGLAGTDAGETVALRVQSATPFSDLVVSHRMPGDVWQPEATLFGDGSVAYGRMALDPNGWGVAVARRFVAGTSYATWTRERGSDGQWAAAVEAAPLDSGFGEPQVAVAGPGRALLAWRQNSNGEVSASSLVQGGSWAAPALLSSAGADGDGVAIATDGGGGGLVVWREDNEQILAARYTPAGGFAAAQLVHAELACCVSAPAVALASGGRALVAFEAGGSVFVSTYDPGLGVWSAAQAVDGPGCAGTVARPRVALNDQGHALATWYCNDELFSARRDSAGTWAMPESLGDAAAAKDSVLALDPNGVATVLWSQEPSPGANRIVVCRRAAAGQPFSAETPISSSGRCAVAPRLAALSNGNLRAAWTFTINCDFSQGRGSEGADFE